jgi:hypothetical protein
MTKDEMAHLIRYFAKGVSKVIYPYSEGSNITAQEWARWNTSADAVIEQGKISLNSRYIVLECDLCMFIAPDSIVRHYNCKRLAYWYKF